MGGKERTILCGKRSLPRAPARVPLIRAKEKRLLSGQSKLLENFYTISPGDWRGSFPAKTQPNAAEAVTGEKGATPCVQSKPEIKGSAEKGKNIEIYRSNCIGMITSGHRGESRSGVDSGRP